MNQLKSVLLMALVPPLKKEGEINIFLSTVEAEIRKILSRQELYLWQLQPMIIFELALCQVALFCSVVRLKGSQTVTLLSAKICHSLLLCLTGM